MIGEKFSKEASSFYLYAAEEITRGKKSLTKTMSYLVQILIPLSSFTSLVAIQGTVPG